mgnify:CR=1 FL=1
MPQNVLKMVLNQGRVVPIKNKIVDLVEKDTSAKLTLVKLRNIPDNSIVISCDGFKTDTFFNGKGNGANQRCDYMVISGETIHFIELKSHENADDVYKEECIRKFNATGCITKYIDSVVQIFFNKPEVFSRLEKRYILFYFKPSISKTSTSLRPVQKPLHNSPESFCAIPVGNNDEVELSVLN